MLSPDPARLSPPVSYIVLALGACMLLAAAPRSGPHAAMEELVAADHSLSQPAAAGTATGALFTALAETVIAPMPTLDMPSSRYELIARLEKEDAGADRSVWTLVRSGVSADGTHGYTLGHVVTHGPDDATRPAKYIAYWIKRPEGWRIAAFKRVARPAGPVYSGKATTDWPDKPMKESGGSARNIDDVASLDAAERDFAAEAQRIGLGRAFAKHGSATAVNMGQGADFTVGASNIGREMGSETTSPVNWAPDGTIVAPSGDLGINWGRLRSNDPAQAGRTAPFFTVWRRANRNARWFYVAE